MMRILGVKSWLLAGTFLLFAVSYSHAKTPVCGPGATVPVSGGRNGIEIDKAWSGVTVSFDAIARNGKTYLGYYDADRWLTVAQLDPVSGVVCRTRLPSQFAGWDGHNTIALAFDAAGRLQVAGNMHASPLVYGAAPSPDSIAGIALSPMIGTEEESVTYPDFITGPNDKLFFTYRSGVSGDGEWVINVREGTTWKRASEKPIFSSTFDGRPTNAYPTPFRVSQDGYVHVAAVWRRTPDVASNYAITYARTRDFVHWEDHNGQTIMLPMNPGNSDTIESTGENRGLVNGARVGVALNGKPVVAYTKYGSDGRNSIILASPSQNEWHHSIVATANQQTVIAGGGSVPNLPTVGDLQVNSGNLGRIVIAFPGEKRKQVLFDIDSLNVAVVPEAPARTNSARPVSINPPPGLADVRRNSRDIPVDKHPGDTAGTIVYFSQGVNGDKTRKCTRAQPTACNPPPSPLIVVPR
ncbi:BNR repeat-containing protein [Agrobacterium pusense]|uniref:BNR repeat-containing protein n=1 Tax=Agrobacterium pusense TaxID=648995 RepID=UPI0013008677|nr:BNR repeat-containing protein [Agrobacterium pusense]